MRKRRKGTRPVGRPPSEKSMLFLVNEAIRRTLGLSRNNYFSRTELKMLVVRDEGVRAEKVNKSTSARRHYEKRSGFRSSRSRKKLVPGIEHVLRQMAKLLSRSQKAPRR